MKKDIILVLNAGSSSLKFSLFEMKEDLPVYAKGRIVEIGSHPRLFINGECIKVLPETTDQSSALAEMMCWVHATERNLTIKAIGHRIVHGGDQLTAPTYLTEDVIKTLETFIPLAPLHQPHHLSAIRQLADVYPDLVQIGCFDTAFHVRHDPVFSYYALPRYLREQGIRRYGFHGLSYEWVVHTLKEHYPDHFSSRVVVAPFGNGASLCAIQAGKSIDTTMGMTTLDGLPMGTRCGSIDPGVILYMLNTLKMQPDEIEQLLYCDSGLKGLSGLSHNVEVLLADNSEEVAFALRFFSMMVAQHIARMAVALGGIDTLVFTGGIGTHATPIRQRILSHLQWLNPLTTLVLETNEEQIIAKGCRHLLS